MVAALGSVDSNPPPTVLSFVAHWPDFENVRVCARARLGVAHEQGLADYADSIGFLRYPAATTSKEQMGSPLGRGTWHFHGCSSVYGQHERIVPHHGLARRSGAW